MRLVPGLLVVVLALAVSGCGPRIDSGYRDLFTTLGPPYRRPGPHAGVDFGGAYGDPVLAVADGVVSALRENLACGIGLIIEHEAFGRFTAYCHMQKRLVGFDQQVKRGQIVGRMGDTGDAATCRPIRPCPHVHFELVADGASHAQAIETVTFDPLAFSAGCFDPRKSYPTDRLVLTHPVRC